MSKFKENVKKIIYIVRIVLVTLITLGLYSTFKTMETPLRLLIILIFAHLLILGLAHILENGVFKKRGKIKEYLIKIIHVSLTGIGLHIISGILLIFPMSTFNILGEIISLFGFICSAILLQKISFFKII